ncbi:hypothetical protein D9M70_568040 [compost metagenome]
MPFERVRQRRQQEEHGKAEQPEAVDRRVNHVGADRRAVGHRLDRTPFFQRTQDQEHRRDLHQPHQQPLGAGEGLFGIAAKAEVIDHRQHHVLEQRAFDLPDPAVERLPHYRLPSCCPMACRAIQPR